MVSILKDLKVVRAGNRLLLDNRVAVLTRLPVIFDINQYGDNPLPGFVIEFYLQDFSPFVPSQLAITIKDYFPTDKMARVLIPIYPKQSAGGFVPAIVNNFHPQY